MIRLTEYAVHKNVITVVIRQIKRKGRRIDFRTSAYLIIETVAGINKRDKFSKRKVARPSICDTLIILKKRQKKSKIRAKTLPGNGKGKSDDITSPIRQIKNMITI